MAAAVAAGREVIMLNVSSETIGRLMDLSRVFHAKEAVSFPEEPSDASGDWATQILADHTDDLTLQEFRSIIDDLEPDQQQEIVALLWVGRGDFAADEWQAALEEARNNWTLETADYLIAHPLLADYLREGLDLVGPSQEDL